MSARRNIDITPTCEIVSEPDEWPTEAEREDYYRERRGGLFGERELLLAAVGESPDDDVPRLVLADWLQENGEESLAHRIRYCVRAEGVIRAVPAVCSPASRDERKKTHALLGRHPQSEWLYRLHAVATCRRPCVWGRLTDGRSYRAVAVAREFAHGLASAEDLGIARKDAWNAADAADAAYAYAAADAAYAADAAAYAAYAAYAAAYADAAAAYAADAERGYHRAVYLALAAIPPLEVR